MKFGILYNQNNLNIGDDIQAYATARYLPSVDYFIDREHINEFKSDENEPVAVIMNAWYMWEKWNWPPSKCIVPHMVGFHYADHKLAVQPGSPLKYEVLEGLGGDYLRAYEPIGCRDFFTMGKLKDIGIDAYFSGCITMTLPKMPKIQVEKEYVCIVDVEESVKKRLLEILKDTEYEVKVITHNRSRDSSMPWEERKRIVEDLLTTYRNAKYVITKRLHCALPCLSQGTPVLIIKGMTDDIRFSPYGDWLHWITVKDFLNGNYTYDFNEPLPNKLDFVATRDALEKSCMDFVQAMLTETRSTEELNRFTHTDEEVHQWRYKLMEQTLSMWLTQERENNNQKLKLQSQNNKLTADLKKSTADLKKTKADLKKTTEDLKKSNANLKKVKADLKAVTDKYEKTFMRRLIRFAKKVRRAFSFKKH